MLTLAGVLALSVVFALDWDGRQGSAQSLSCGITEVTFTSGGFIGKPSISADGTRIVFSSDRDLTGGNPDFNQELFLYNSLTNSVTQVTNTTGGGSGEPSLSADGARIAFVSDRDLIGGNADANFEVFIYDANTNTFAQVTNTMGLFGNSTPWTNVDGTRIAFESDRNLTGGNADANVEVFIYHVNTNTFTQVTNTTAHENLRVYSISANGTRIAIESQRNLTGGNADLNNEIFLYDATTNIITQVTNTSLRDSYEPKINADGTRIAFDSYNDLTGGNADLNGEVFFYDSLANSFTQVTNTTFGGGLEDMSISGDGTHIAFEAERDLTGGNADLNSEIFVFDTTTNIFTQVTDTTGGDSNHPSLNADGTRVAFESDRDLTGGNADGNEELFLATCVPVSADLFIGQSADQTKVKQGEMLTYTVTVGNLGPDGAAGVEVFDELSSGVAFVSAQANKGSFTAPPVGQTGIVTWNLGSMGSGDQETSQIQVTVTIRGRDTITNNARVISSIADPDGTNNSSSLTTTVQPGKKK